MSNTRVGEIELEKGTVVIADTLGVHFDAEVWGEDASEFNPERWCSKATNSDTYVCTNALFECKSSKTQEKSYS